MENLVLRLACGKMMDYPTLVSSHLQCARSRGEILPLGLHDAEIWSIWS